MANLLRTAKSGADWTKTDLAAYNIQCQRQDPVTFYGLQVLPQPNIDPELLTAHGAADATNPRTAALIDLVDNTRRDSDHTQVVTLVIELFHALDYVTGNRAVGIQRNLGFVVCGEQRCATTDVCLVDREDDRDVVLLVVQEDRRGARGDQGVDPVAQIVIQAIAAFSSNNEERMKAGKDPIDAKVMSGITVSGKSPTFYKIPVTQDLVQHIARGTYPPNPTSVTFCGFV